MRPSRLQGSLHALQGPRTRVSASVSTRRTPLTCSIACAELVLLPQASHFWIVRSCPTSAISDGMWRSQGGGDIRLVTLVRQPLTPAPLDTLAPGDAIEQGAYPTAPPATASPLRSWLSFLGDQHGERLPLLPLELRDTAGGLVSQQFVSGATSLPIEPVERAPECPGPGVLCPRPGAPVGLTARRPSRSEPGALRKLPDCGASRIHGRQLAS